MLDKQREVELQRNIEAKLGELKSLFFEYTSLLSSSSPFIPYAPHNLLNCLEHMILIIDHSAQASLAMMRIEDT